jgi:hypothetical protein
MREGGVGVGAEKGGGRGEYVVTFPCGEGALKAKKGGVHESEGD